MMPAAMPGSERSLLRNALVLTGLLLTGVGLGDMIVGRLRIARYEEMLRAAPPVESPRAPALFTTASEGQERSTLVRAKLGFYQLLVTCGQVLVSLGAILVVAGVLRVRRLALVPHAPPRRLVH